MFLFFLSFSVSCSFIVSIRIKKMRITPNPIIIVQCLMCVYIPILQTGEQLKNVTLRNLWTPSRAQLEPVSRSEKPHSNFVLAAGWYFNGFSPCSNNSYLFMTFPFIIRFKPIFLFFILFFRLRFLFWENSIASDRFVTSLKLYYDIADKNKGSTWNTNLI